MTNNNNNDIGNANLILSKSVDNINNKKNSIYVEDNLDLLINSLSKDLNEQLEKDYDFALNIIDNQKSNTIFLE